MTKTKNEKRRNKLGNENYLKGFDAEALDAEKENLFGNLNGIINLPTGRNRTQVFSLGRSITSST